MSLMICFSDLYYQSNQFVRALLILLTISSNIRETQKSWNSLEQIKRLINRLFIPNFLPYD